MITAIISSVTQLVSDYFNGKRKVKQAEIEREVKALTHEADWDTVQAKAGASSWKDEWLTLLISIPLIMAFIPEAALYVDAGFGVLATMPEWYQYLVGVVFAASFGIKKVTDVLGKFGR